ncbi:rhomboid family protein [Halalkalibacillus halophilus]|uniref:rhomboid family protein n=1 Tax=Halalkalibacillus halophilus TaxID=392827 RepID=UPI0003F561EC|nr:rhomboid family intramembrane serine protease [Halalkalibacillus halophilus]
MFITEKYKFYKLTNYLIEQAGFEIRYITKSGEGIVLEKYEKRRNKVIFIQHQSFDWSNHLEKHMNRQIKFLMEQVRQFRGRKTDYHLVFVSDFAPVDNWQRLQETRNINESGTKTSSLYYVTSENIDEELQRLSQSVDDTIDIRFTQVPSIPEQEQQSMYLHQKIESEYRRKDQQFKEVFQYGKVKWTYTLILVNLLVFFLLESEGSSTDSMHLIEWGAKFNPAIASGEWWRIGSSMFLHIGVFHLFMNMLALFFLGEVNERIYGSKRFLGIYFTAGIFGGVASFATNNAVAAGASGAIFGLFGALLFFGLHYKELFFKTMGSSLLIIVAINIAFGFTIPQIDNGAHLGGLLGGFLAAQVLHLPKKQEKLKQFTASILVVGLIIGMGSYGLMNVKSTENPEELAMIVQYYIDQEQYTQAIDVTDRFIENNTDHHYTYFYRAIAYMQKGSTERAETDFQRAIELHYDFPEAHYNLAVLYDRNNHSDARKHAEIAHEQRPQNEQFKSLYEELSQ